MPQGKKEKKDRGCSLRKSHCATPEPGEIKKRGKEPRWLLKERKKGNRLHALFAVAARERMCSRSSMHNRKKRKRGRAAISFAERRRTRRGFFDRGKNACSRSSTGRGRRGNMGAWFKEKEGREERGRSAADAERPKEIRLVSREKLEMVGRGDLSL